MRTFALTLGLIITAAVALSCRAAAEGVTPTSSPIFALPMPSLTALPSTATPTATPAPGPTAEPLPAPVTFSPEPGEYDGPLAVSLATSDAPVEIRYTLDGSDPLSDSANVYSGQFALLDSTTVRAIALYGDARTSAEGTAEYSLIKHQLDSPSVTGGGAFTEPQTATVDSNEPDATVIYTLDGSTPTAENGAAYSGPIAIDHSLTLKVTVTRPGYIDSEVSESIFRIYSHLVESDEDIFLGPGDRMVIEDTLFLHRGDIRLTGDAQLIIKDSMLRHLQDFAFEHSLDASDDSSILIENSAIGTDCNGSFNWSFHDNSSMLVNGMDPTHAGCNTWNFMSGESNITVSRWDTFGGTVCDNSTVYIANSDRLEVELCLPGGSRINTSLPSNVKSFKFGPTATNKVGFSLELSDVTVDGWGINVLPGSEITIHDSDAVTIGVIVGFPWQGKTVTLSGLRNGHYDDQFWQIGPDAALRLVNTTVYGWEPNVFANNTLIIRDSDYTASAVNGGSGHYQIESSAVDLLSANENVTMAVTGSVITGDVIANGDSVITLDGCVVEGDVFTRDNGRVILRDTTVLGEKVAQDNGAITEENG
jgi:hypothetical protein